MSVKRTYREAVAAASGLICPQCGCRDIRKLHTYKVVGGVRRTGECRHCGRRLKTFERVVTDWEKKPAPPRRERGVDWESV